MQRRINRLNDHVVLCGYGQVGRAIEEEIRAGEVVAAIDRRGPDHSPECDRHFMLIGEATDDHLVLQAGLDRAKILIVALDFGS